MVSSVSQVNRGAVNFITAFDLKKKVQQIRNEFFKEEYPLLEEEVKDVIRYNKRSIKRSDKDVNLPRTITKEKHTSKIH